MRGTHTPVPLNAKEWLTVTATGLMRGSIKQTCTNFPVNCYEEMSHYAEDCRRKGWDVKIDTEYAVEF